MVSGPDLICDTVLIILGLEVGFCLVLPVTDFDKNIYIWIRLLFVQCNVEKALVRTIAAFSSFSRMFYVMPPCHDYQQCHNWNILMWCLIINYWYGLFPNMFYEGSFLGEFQQGNFLCFCFADCFFQVL